MISSYVLIIGAMKSGTTTLFDALAQHPQIAPSTPKEPGFFAFEEVWAQGFDWYESLFAFDPSLHRYGLDGSTDYTKRPFCPNVPERLAASAPRQFRLIYIMRDPLRRLESHARHTQRTRREVGRCQSPRADHSLDAGISPVSLAISRYAYQLSPFRDFFDAGRLHLTTLEALEADFRGEMTRVLDFLELPHHQASLQRRHSNRVDAKVQRHWLSHRIRHSRHLGFLAPAARQALARPFEKEVKVAGRFRLTEAERAELAEMLCPEISKLHSDFGFSGHDAWNL